MPRRLVLVRHGEASHNVLKEYHRHKDAELTGRGREQARRLGARLCKDGLRATHVLSSPLYRARETAELAFGVVLVDARERFVRNHVCNLMPGETRADAHETDDDIAKRAQQVLTTIRTLYPEDDVVVLVTHSLFIRAVQRVLDPNLDEHAPWVGLAEHVIYPL